MSFTLNSGLRIFDIIEILMSSPSSRREICELLNRKEIKADIKTITKYIRTLKLAGFDIRVENKKFQVYKTPFTTSLTKEEKDGLMAVMALLNNFFKGGANRDYKLMEEKLRNIFALKNNLEINIENKPIDFNFEADENLSFNIMKLSKYLMEDNVKLKIKYEKKRYIIFPKEIKYKRNGVFLYAYNKTKEKNSIFRVDLITDIKFIEYVNPEFPTTGKQTIFKITGRLKKNYILREGEVAKYMEDEVYVTNVYEDKEELFNRLIKYGKYCEVTYPESDRKKFKNKIKNLIKHYKSM